MSNGDLERRLHDRLDQLGRDRPDLESALQLQRTLLGREIELVDICRAGGLPHLSLPPRYLATKLKSGLPALHGEPVPLPMGLLSLTIRDFCNRLSTGSTAGAADAILHAFESGLNPAAALSSCFGRDQGRVRALAMHFEISADLLWLVAELSLAPFAHLLQRQAFTSPPQAVADAIHKWDRGFCPACGSWPALQEAGEHGHVLRCSFCAMGWTLLSYRCVYCGNDAEAFITAAPDPEVPGRRLQLCGACGGYAKVIEMATPSEFPLAAVEDLASLDLDMAAIERNYMRPALPVIRRAGPGKAGGTDS